MGKSLSKDLVHTNGEPTTTQRHTQSSARRMICDEASDMEIDLNQNSDDSEAESDHDDILDEDYEEPEGSVNDESEESESSVNEWNLDNFVIEGFEAEVPKLNHKKRATWELTKPSQQKRMLNI